MLKSEAELIELLRWLGVDKSLKKKAFRDYAREIFTSSTDDYASGIDGKEQMPALRKLLEELHGFMNELKAKHNLSKGDMHSWWALYQEDRGKDLAAKLKKQSTTDYFELSDDVADKTMAYTYLALNILGVAIAALALHPGAGIVTSITGATAATAISSTWNYIDVVGGYVQAVKAFRDGNYATGFATFTSSSQLLAFTMTANIGYYVTHTVSAAMAGGFMGFAFAACMVIAAGIEYLSVLNYDSKMEHIKPQL